LRKNGREKKWKREIEKKIVIKGKPQNCCFLLHYPPQIQVVITHGQEKDPLPSPID
jgi:hypothetical protein